MQERLQKLMAKTGLGSRRACEALIAAGRVSVNGQIAVLGDKADLSVDRVVVDGKPLKAPEPRQYIALHKPRGVLSTVEAPDPRPTVRDLVPVSGTLYPVGRLDVDSEGLILLTNDGELADRLTHPRYGHEKEYRVLVARHLDEQQLKAWQSGVVLEDGYRTAPAQVWVEGLSGKGAWVRVIMKEGRKRQIRETGSQIGLPVVRIIRVRIGTLLLGGLKRGEWRYLSADEVAALQGKPVKEKPSRKPVEKPTHERQAGNKTARPDLNKFRKPSTQRKRSSTSSRSGR